jgi:hypothetical protein
MAREKIDLIGNLAIIQGETYQSLTLTFPGDLTGHTPRGQIRTALLQEEGELLAEFYFDTPIYDADTDTTNIYPYLTPGQTAALLKTKYQGTEGQAISKRNVYFYDIELELGGQIAKTFPGVVQVIGEVTDGTSPPTYPDPIVYLQAGNNLSELENPEEAIANLGLDDVVRTGDIEDFETSDELDARDLENRKWVNFSGIPAWITNATEFGQSLVNAASTAAAKILLGLDNVNNTSDADKPISDATLTALQVLDGEISVNTAARHDAVTTVDSDTIQFGLTGQEITGSVKDGSIDADKLSSDVNESLDKADNAVQPDANTAFTGDITFNKNIIVNNNTLNAPVIFGQSANRHWASIAIGVNVLTSSTGSSNDVGIGAGVLEDQLTGGSNTAVGHLSQQELRRGAQNTSHGVSSLNKNVVGQQNTAIGSRSLRELGRITNAGSFVVGVQYEIVSPGNTDFTLIGAANNNELTKFTATGIGSGTGTAAPTNQNNIGIGDQVGLSLISGNNNIVLGASAEPSSPNVSNEVTVGNASINRVRIPGLGIDWTPSNKPITAGGFTYDQQAEPTVVSVGQTWRERSGTGLIVGDWEWSGSLWLSIQRFYATGDLLGYGGSYSRAILSSATRHNQRFLIQDFIHVYSVVSGDASNFWTVGNLAPNFIDTPSGTVKTSGNVFGIPTFTSHSINVYGEWVQTSYLGVNAICNTVAGGLLRLSTDASRTGAPGLINVIGYVVTRNIR